jgi:hypothetical protein
MKLVAIEIAHPIQPRFPVEIGYVDHQCLALPVAARISQPEVDVAIRVFRVVGIDRADGMAELEEQRQITRPLEDLERLVVVNAARCPERKALRSRIGGCSCGEVFRSLLERRRLIRNAISFHNARARRRIFSCKMRLQSEVGSTERLPDTGEIGMAIRASGDVRLAS